VHCVECGARFMLRWNLYRAYWDFQGMPQGDGRWEVLEVAPSYIPTGPQAEKLANTLDVVLAASACISLGVK